MSKHHNQHKTSLRSGEQNKINDPVQFHPTERFCAWLKDMDVSLAFTCAQANKLVLIGQQNDRLKVFTRTIENCRGLFAREGRLYVASEHSIWTYVDTINGKSDTQTHDALYYPHHAQVVGVVDMHDLYVPEDPSQAMMFANTRFSCVAQTDDMYSFQPLWTPPFISSLMPEDRCHLTGVAVDTNTEQPHYVSVASTTNYYESWRLDRIGSGAVLDITTGEPILEGLTLPHAPRLHKGTLYVLDSGNGTLGRVDIQNKSFVEIFHFPGLVKGLSFIGQYAVVSSSSFMHENSVADLPFYERIRNEGEEPQCALYVIDLEKQELVHSLRITGALKEIDALTLIKGRQNPAILKLDADALSKLYYLPKTSVGKTGHRAPDKPVARTLKKVDNKKIIKKNDDFAVINVFEHVTPEIKDAIIAFWLAHKALPRSVDPYVRAMQACLVTLNPQDEIISLTTVYKEPLGPILPQEIAHNHPEANDTYCFMRTFTAPDYRHLNLAAITALKSYDIVKDALQKQSEDQPKGMIIVAENKKLNRPLTIRRFKRSGCDILPFKTQKGHTIIRKMF